jgi:HEAT repeat protein
MELRDQTELELQQLVELLGSRDWRVVAAAQEALARAGERGLSAAVVGLAQADPRVRRGCADFLDHYGTDACVDALRHAATHDAVAHVRRAAVHALLCQRCKPCPLTSDLTDFLVRVALEDSNTRVRGEAVWGLGAGRPDPRAVAALRQILRQDSHPALLLGAHHALTLQDPAYREAVGLNARMRGILSAKAKPSGVAAGDAASAGG